MVKKVLINANTLCLPRWGGEGYISGVGRSTSYLLSAFDRIDDETLKISLLVEGPQYIGKIPKFQNLNVYFSPFYSRLGIGKWIRKYILHPSIYHFPDNFNIHNYKGEQYVLTIHDMIQYKKAIELNNLDKIQFYSEKVKNAEAIFTCSEYSKESIINLINIPEEKIKVVYWGIDTSKFKVLSNNKINSCNLIKQIGGRFFLSVSCKDERKNMKTLLEAYEKYQQDSNDKFVLIWSNPPRYLLNTYQFLIEKRKLIFLNYVTDDELVQLYNGAIATLFPSREEGFGFPILESFACGTPVMTCRNSSLIEVGGDFANYVGENSVDDMVDTMRLLSKKIDKKFFANNVQSYIKRFSWINTAKQYIKIYKEL